MRYCGHMVGVRAERTASSSCQQRRRRGRRASRARGCRASAVMARLRPAGPLVTLGACPEVLLHGAVSGREGWCKLTPPESSASIRLGNAPPLQISHSTFMHLCASSPFLAHPAPCPPAPRLLAPSRSSACTGACPPPWKRWTTSGRWTASRRWAGERGRGERGRGRTGALPLDGSAAAKSYQWKGGLCRHCI